MIGDAQVVSARKLHALRAPRIASLGTPERMLGVPVAAQNKAA